VDLDDLVRFQGEQFIVTGWTRTRDYGESTARIELSEVREWYARHPVEVRGE
jgi:hypothetical protein